MTETKLDLQLTDLGNADRFAANYCDRIRHSAIRGWLCWNGSAWAPDSRDAVYEAALNTIRSLAAEAENDGTNRDDQRLIIAHAVHSQSRQAIESMLALASRHPSISIGDDEMDADPWLLAVANGVLDLKRGTMLKHNRTILNSYVTKAAYDVAAKCPRWLKFMQEVFSDRTDLIQWVQKAVGYTLTGSTREQCLFFLFGSGLNGKSTFVEVLSAVIGNYACHTNSDTFMVRNTGSIRNDLARLVGRRMVVATEVQARRALDEVGVKSMTGEERIIARFLHKEFFEFSPAFKIWLAGNHRPNITGTDFAIWRRIRIVPFTVQFKEGQIDRNLRAKLEAEADGILSWAVEGCHRWQLEGLSDLPQAVTDSTQQYRDESDTIGHYARECCTVADGIHIRANELYDSYREWAMTQKEEVLGRSDFWQIVQERYPTLTRYRIEQEWWYQGIMLQEPIPLGAQVEETE